MPRNKSDKSCAKPLLKKTEGVPIVVQQKGIWLVSMRMQVWSLASLSGSRFWHCCELQCRSQMGFGSFVAVAVAYLATVAPIWPLAWELQYAVGVDLKIKKLKKNTVKKKKKLKTLNKWGIYHIHGLSQYFKEVSSSQYEQTEFSPIPIKILTSF